MPGSAAEILRRMGDGRPAGELRLDADTRWAGGRERIIQKTEPLWPRIVGPATGETPPARVAVVVNSAPRHGGKPMNSDETSQSPLQPATFANEGATPAPSADVTTPSPAAPTPAPAAAAQPEKIGIDEFAKIDLRVAKVLAAEKVKGSKKLIKMQIDVGTEQRTIVAGIAEAYEAESLVGRSIVIVANLKPAKLMGIESNGMVLAASPEGGLPALLGFLETPPPPGSRVR
jgi:methionyl-tRNA synthetase